MCQSLFIVDFYQLIAPVAMATNNFFFPADLQLIHF